MRVALIRHLAPVAACGVCYGRTDIRSVAPDPPALAPILAALSGLNRPQLYSSPAERCRSLAVRLGLSLGLTVVEDGRLLELDFGDWEGRRWDKIDRVALDAWAADPAGFVPPGGEPVAALVSRAMAFARSVRERGRDAVVVSHGGPLRLLAPLLRDVAPDVLAPAPSFGSITLIACQALATASAVSAPHSATCATAPSTSPV